MRCEGGGLRGEREGVMKEGFEMRFQGGGRRVVSWVQIHICRNISDLGLPELGTQQYCRDNVTRFSGNKVVCFSNISIFVVHG